MQNKKIKNLKTEVLSDNWYTLNKVTFEYQKTDGNWQTQKREVYERGHGAAVLLYNLEKKTIILICQLRIPTYIQGHSTGMMVEVCAGLLDGDTPEVCMIREVEEETGLRIPKVEKVFEAYMSPGAVTEKIHFFIAPYTDHMRVSNGGGLATEHEDIEVLELTFKEALTMLSNGTIVDAKTIMLLQYAQLNGVLG